MQRCTYNIFIDKLYYLQSRRRVGGAKCLLLPRRDGGGGGGGRNRKLLRSTGLVERLNQMLKQMLRCMVAEDKRDLRLPYVLFGTREAPQSSTGFTPFELLFSGQPKGATACSKRGVGTTAHAPLLHDRTC